MQNVLLVQLARGSMRDKLQFNHYFSEVLFSARASPSMVAAELAEDEEVTKASNVHPNHHVHRCLSRIDVLTD